MEKPLILLVDDNEIFLELFCLQPEIEEFTVVPFSSAEKALAFLADNAVELIISDVQMPQVSGMDFFKTVHDRYPEIPFIFLTAFGSTERAIESVKKGAYHYFEKPLDDKIDLFWSTVREGLDKGRRNRELEALKKEKLLRGRSAATMVGRSKAMEKVFQSIAEVADLPVTVMICGETGTGKELVARAIHDTGNRRDRPFFAVNCNEFSPGILESELFGHEKGAFTGAVGRKKGIFELADRGTLFLDEISNASLELQSKLLRVVENQKFTRVGGAVELASDFRIVAATNIPLKPAVDAGRFRQDLFFRLNVYTIDIPPLRLRREDIPLMATYYLDRFNQLYARGLEGISENAMMALAKYEWPGNVRELVNVMARAVITCKSKMITTGELPFDTQDRISASGFSLIEMEKFVIRRALEKTDYNNTHAAELLGIARKTLIEKIKKYEIK